MIGLPFQLVPEHSLGFVLAALVICSVAAWLLAVLLEKARVKESPQNRPWLLAIVAVAGLGVWTTHFIAMLGYRPDVVFSFDPELTAISGLVAIVVVGVPLALTAEVAARGGRAALGALSGVGIGAMHFIGMNALQRCVVTQNLSLQTAALIIGATFFAAAAWVSGSGRRRALVSLLLVAGVCGTHFTAIAGASLSEINVASGSIVNVVVLSVFVAAGALALFTGAFFALHASQRFEAQERMHATVLSTALHNMSNGLVLVDPKGHVALYNDRVLQLFGLAAEDVGPCVTWLVFLDTIGRKLGWDAARRSQAEIATTAAMLRGTTTSYERAFEGDRMLRISCRPVPGGGAVMTYDDVTDERRVQRQVDHLTHHDPLTGLSNRRRLQDKLQSLFDAKAPFTTLLIDLDHFKAVNDTYGHAAGDWLLIQVARRLEHCVGRHGFMARMGGDEMAVLLDLAVDEAMDIAEAIARDLTEPFVRADDEFSIGCSIGIVAGDEAGDPGALLERAEVALYAAKSRGRGQICRFEDGMLESTAADRALAEDLKRAIRNQEFTLVYQPIFDIGLSTLVGFEALIRWVHPTRGNVSPAEFIPFAEANGLIVAIGEWTLVEACRQAASWPAHVHVAVNVSAVQLRLASVMAHVTHALAESGLTANRLELELTETAMVEDGEQIGSMLTALRTLGCKLSMDDFGTGYSSLTHLCRFPLDRIKIDRSFVDAAPGDPNAMAVLRAVTQMARDLGITTIGEGVETLEQLQILRRVGCSAAQGFHLGRPLPAAEALALTAEHDRPWRVVG